MKYLVGATLATATAVFARIVGFDRSRAFYPVVLIVAASYYCLFAVLGGSDGALWQEAALAAWFAAIAVVGFRTSEWLIVLGLAGHGMMDLAHHLLIANAGVPACWPGFCATFDLAAAGYLALLLVARGKASPPAPSPQFQTSPSAARLSWMPASPPVD